MGNLGDAANNASLSLTGRDLPDHAGNATESTLNKVIDNTLIGKIPGVNVLARKGAEKIAQTVNNQVASRTGRGSRSNPMGRMEPPSNTSGGGGRGSGSGPRAYDNIPSGGGVNYPVHRVNFNSEPFNFILNTGIPANVYSPYHLEGTTSNISMILSGCAINIPTSTSTFYVADFVNKLVATYFSNAIQRAVSFSVGGNITGDSLMTWVNSIIDALHVYFYYKSILSYNNSPLNRNDAMLALRQSITADDLNNLYELERMLLASPLPPNLVNIIWWFNGNYTNGNLPGSCILKFQTVNATVDTTTKKMTLSPGWSTIMSSLNSQRSFSNIIARATNWIMPELPSYPSLPVYDANWHTVFVNSPLSCTSSAGYSAFAPLVSTPTASIVYNTYTNDLDGAALSLCSIYDSSVNNWSPCVMRPKLLSDTSGSFFSNRWYYSQTSSTSAVGWYDALNSTSGQYANACGFTYNIATWSSSGQTYATVGLNKPGSEPVFGVNTSSILQSALQFVEWLFSIDTIGYINDNRVYDSPNSNNIGIPNKRSNNKRRR